MNYLRTLALAALAAGAISGPAFAQQEGLVNVNVEGNTVQVPIGIAAQVCGIDANVLAQQVTGSEETVCDITQEVAAEHNIGGQHGGGGGGGQEGLVNVNVEGNTVQVPVGVAAQVCDVDANVLARQFRGTEDIACDIDQATAAEHNIGG
jgi:hypothetical protein